MSCVELSASSSTCWGTWKHPISKLSKMGSTVSALIIL